MGEVTGGECPECGLALLSGDAQCYGCGWNVEKGGFLCPECGFPLDGGVCEMCGWWQGVEFESDLGG
jgi:predicted amidophosphoribosyltransferase